MSPAVASFCSATAPFPTLHQLFGTDFQKTSVSLLILLTHLLISPILRSHSPLLRSTHDLKSNSFSYPIPVPLLHHQSTTRRQPSSPTATVAPRYLLGLTFQDFDLAPKQNEKLAIADWIWCSAG